MTKADQRSPVSEIVDVEYRYGSVDTSVDPCARPLVEMSEMTNTSFITRIKANLSLLALASCTLGMNLLVTLFNFYYVKVFLQRYHITSSWLNIAQTFFMVCNFMIGPFLAYAQDYGHPAWRNRRRLVMFAGPAFAMVFMLPWFPFYDIHNNENGDDNWQPGVHLMICLLLWNLCFTIVSSCASGLFAELSLDHHSRVKALTYNQVAALIAAAAVFPVDALSRSTADFRAFQICCGVASLIAMGSFIFTGMNASDVVAQIGRGRSETDDCLTEDGKSSPPNEKEFIEAQQTNESCKRRFATVITYLTTVCQVLRTRNFWCAVVANFMTFFRVCITYNFLAVYTEGLTTDGFLPTGSVAIASFYLVAQVTPRIIFILASPFIKRLGTYKTLQGSLVLVWLNAAIGLCLGKFVGYNTLVATFLFESILVSFQDLFVIVYSEVVDQDVKTHKRELPASTVIFTLTGLFVQPSTALAPMIIVKALNIGDYDQYKDNVRAAPEYTKQVMFLVSTCVPAVASIVSFLSMYFYKSPHDRKNSAVVTRL